MNDLPGQSKGRASRRKQREAVESLLRKKMQQADYPLSWIEEGCAAWRSFCDSTAVHIRSLEAHAAALEYLVALSHHQKEITQRSLAERYQTSQASIARLVNLLTPFFTSLLPTPQSTNSLASPLPKPAPSRREVSTKKTEAIISPHEIARLRKRPLVTQSWGMVWIEDERETSATGGASQLHSGYLLCYSEEDGSWLAAAKERYDGDKAAWLQLFQRAILAPWSGESRRPSLLRLAPHAPTASLAMLLEPLSCRCEVMRSEEVEALSVLLKRHLFFSPYAQLAEAGRDDRMKDAIASFFSLSSALAPRYHPRKQGAFVEGEMPSEPQIGGLLDEGRFWQLGWLRGAALPSELRRELFTQELVIADALSYPLLRCYHPQGALLPLRLRDLPTINKRLALLLK